MMQRPPRPTGVAILAILDIIGGIIVILLGALIAAVSSSSILETYGYGMLSGIVALVGGFLILVGLLALVVGWGFWSGKGWAWTLAVVLYILGLLFGLLSLAAGNFTSIVSLLIDVLLLWYLWRPNVKSFFGKGMAQPPPAPIAPPPPPPPSQ